MYVQQGVRKIVVVVRGEGNVAPAGTKETDPNETVDSDVVSEHGKMSKRTKRMIITNATHAFAITKQLAYLGMNYSISRVADRNGDQVLQDRFARKLEVIKDNTNIASSIAMGYVYGRWGGPVGAVLGAFMGGAQSIATTAIKYGERDVAYNAKLFKQNNAIAYTRARANLSATTGRLR